MASLLTDRRVARTLKMAKDIPYGDFQGDGMQLGATFLVDVGGNVLMDHRQQHFGDFPSMEEVCWYRCAARGRLKARRALTLLCRPVPSWSPPCSKLPTTVSPPCSRNRFPCKRQRSASGTPRRATNTITSTTTKHSRNTSPSIRMASILRATLALRLGPPQTPSPWEGPGPTLSRWCT
jgi:hypothetical protein